MQPPPIIFQKIKTYNFDTKTINYRELWRLEPRFLAQKSDTFIVSLYFQILVDLGRLELPYETQFKLLSTRLVYPKSSLALSEQTNQRLTTLYYIHQFLLE